MIGVRIHTFKYVLPRESVQIIQTQEDRCLMCVDEIVFLCVCWFCNVVWTARSRARRLILNFEPQDGFAQRVYVVQRNRREASYRLVQRMLFWVSVVISIVAVICDFKREYIVNYGYRQALKMRDKFIFTSWRCYWVLIYFCLRYL